MQPVAIKMMPDKTSLTIADIARMANVSKSTVSRALNDSPLLNDATKERIRTIAHQQNFRINTPARLLSLKQSRTIAFVTQCYSKDFSVSELFEAEMMGGVSRELYDNGYDMLVAYVNSHDPEWAHQYLIREKWPVSS